MRDFAELVDIRSVEQLSCDASRGSVLASTDGIRMAEWPMRAETQESLTGNDV
jgi:hypothetical protein